ncbi:MAG TPA: hypothetical protein VF331_22250 [Polyangiales bacterium]
MHSDDNGGKRAQGPRDLTADRRPTEKIPVSSLRDRIRQAGTAAARASEIPPAPSEPAHVAGAARSSASGAIDGSGIRTRPEQGRRGSSVLPASALFAPPPARNSMPPRLPGEPSRPVPPSVVPPRTSSPTQIGLGAVSRALPVSVQPNRGVAPPHAPKLQPVAAPASSARSVASSGERRPADVSHAKGADTEPFDMTTARTRPMPQVRPPEVPSYVAPASAPPPPRPDCDTSPSSRPPVPGLLRSSQPGSAVYGQYSVREVSAEYIDPRRSSTPPAALPASLAPVRDPVSSAPMLGDEADRDDSDDPLARSRRSTPKARPGRRRPTRVTRHEVAASAAATARTGYERDDESAVKRRAAVAALDPPVRVPGRPPEPERAALSSDRPLAPVPRHEPQRVSAPVPSAPVSELPSAEQGVHSGVTAVAAAAEASRARLPASPSADAGYQPLPVDRESYEAFVRSQSARAAPGRDRPEWRDQETQLISRASLDGPSRVGTGLRRLVGSKLGVLLVVAALGVAAWQLRAHWRDEPLELSSELASSGTPPAAAAPVAAPSAATTLLVTEPSGAEIVLGGAVVGNTPAEVPRPSADELYLLRLSGFEPQLVRISPRSGSAIRITLTPVGSAPAAPLPAAQPAR